MARVCLYSNRFGVANAQTTYATDAGGEIQTLRQRLDRALSSMGRWDRRTHCMPTALSPRHRAA